MLSTLALNSKMEGGQKCNLKRLLVVLKNTKRLLSLLNFKNTISLFKSTVSLLICIILSLFFSPFLLSFFEFKILLIIIKLIEDYSV